MTLAEGEPSGISLDAQQTTFQTELLKAAEAGKLVRLQVCLRFARPNGYQWASGYIVGGIDVQPEEATVKALWGCVEAAITAAAKVGPEKARAALEAL